MLSILVAHPKGGCGKSTITTNLCSALASFDYRVAMADVDPQASSSYWHALRNNDAIELLPWNKKFCRPRRAVSHLVIDSAARMSNKTLDGLIRFAHVVIVPVLPSVFDQRAAEDFLGRVRQQKQVAKLRCRVMVVLNRVRPATQTAAQSNAFFTDSQEHVTTRLRDSQLYPMLTAKGAGVFDRRSTRARSLQRDWIPILDYLESLQRLPTPKAHKVVTRVHQLSRR